MDAAIVAVGCAGGRMVNRIIERHRIMAEYLAINTDRRELDAYRVSRKILIGEQRFQGRGVTKPLPWEGLDHLAYALVAIKMLAGVDRLVTVPLGELLRRGVSEEEVLRAGDKLVARAVVRLSAVGIRFLAVLSHWSLSATLRCAYCQRQTANGRPHWGFHVPHRQDVSGELASRRRELGTVSARPLTLADNHSRKDVSTTFVPLIMTTLRARLH